MRAAKIGQLQEALSSGDQRALAKAITLVENGLPGAEALLQKKYAAKPAKIVGITGPPGAGKSTLVNALVTHWLAAGSRIAILAVDPSSPFNFGALLGDRIRLASFYTNPNVFIRSLASRGALGGLHPQILEVTDLVKNAGFDLVLVETVGVGQSEVDIAGLADCTVVALVPEAGDMVQTMKAGLLEIADVFVVNKADRAGSEAMYRHLKTMVHERSADGAETEVIKTIATSGEGIADVAKAIEHALHAPPHVRKLLLLAEKCWQLIARRRMEDLPKGALLRQLSAAVKQPDFNLYAFAESFENSPAQNHEAQP